MRTLIILKPDGVQKFEVRTDILSLLIHHKLDVLFSLATILPKQAVREFYKDHSDQFYFSEMVEWMSSGTIIVFIVDGEDVINKCRIHIVGRDSTGIRGKYKVSGIRNLAHTSDSEDSFLREIYILSKYISIPIADIVEL